MILRIFNILTDALSPSCISGRVVNAAGTAAARSRYYRPAAGKMSCFQAVLRSSDHSRCQEPVGLRKILLRRWENGPNHPDFPLRRISHAPRNHDALFSLSPPPRYEPLCPKGSWDCFNLIWRILWSRKNTERNNIRFNNIFVSSTGFRGYQRNTDARLDLPTAVIFKLKMH